MILLLSTIAYVLIASVYFGWKEAEDPKTKLSGFVFWFWPIAVAAEFGAWLHSKLGKH